jgi:hypothetical protein
VLDARVRELLSAPISLELLELIAIAGADRRTEDHLLELLGRARSGASRYRGDFSEHLESLRSKAASLQDGADWLSRHMERWWSDLDRSAQLWVTTRSDAPEPDRVLVDLRAYSPLVSKPRRAFWTSTISSPYISPWLHWLQVGEDQRPGPYHIWRLTPSATARVYEIHSPSDWSVLARTYPSGHSPTDPQWQSVSEDWDGIHVSLAGLLTAQDMVYESGDLTTELRGWDMESTAWFRWSFTSVELFDPIV